MIRPRHVAALVALSICACDRPAPAAGAVRFAHDGHARIPFDLQNGHVWVRGVVGDSDSLWIVVDTGAASSVMDESLARSLGLELHGRHEAHGAGGTQPGSSVADITLRVGGLSIHRDSLATVDFGAITAQSAHPMQLVLGYELFSSYRVRFDYAARAMDVWDAAHAPGLPAGITLPMTLVERHPYVEGTLALPGRAPLHGRFVIDTGSSRGILLEPTVTARESLERAFPRTLRIVVRGVGGELLARLGRADSLTLGGLSFGRPLVGLPEPGAGRISSPGSLGNIGSQLLERCRVTLDYPRRRVHLERGPDFDRPFEADMSGISFRREAAGWAVRLVNPGTPAAEAGLREGDVVTRVDGEPAAGIELSALRRVMEREGRTVVLGIRRGGRESSLSLVLRRLL